MPEGDEETPSSYTATGHIGNDLIVRFRQMLILQLIAHLNLKEENMAFKYLIAQVILDVSQINVSPVETKQQDRKIKK